mmetsp:Transcript_5612/g.16568  ORF Transcript_5612/g.16568 Transcript_5612/m.16568 type:complete len:707 (-) Transcript_5612:92-2212(-)
MRAFTIALVLVAATAELELVKEIEHGVAKTEFQNDAYNQVTFSSSTLAVTAGTAGDVTLFDAWSLVKQRGIFRCDYSNIQSAALSDTTVALAGREGVQLFDAYTGEQLREIDFDSTVYAVAFSPDGKKWAAGWDDSTRVYDTATGELLSEFPSDDAVESVAWSPDGQLLATGTDAWESKIQIYFVDSGKLRVEIDVGGFLHDTLAWAPDSKTLTAASPRGTQPVGVAIYDAKTGGRVTTFELDEFDYAAFAPDGLTLAARGGSSFRDEVKVVLFDVASGDIKQTIEKGGDDVSGLEFSAEGTLALGERGKVSLYREASAVPPLSPAPTPLGLAYTQFTEIPRPSNGGSWPKYIAFSPDGLRLVEGDAHPLTIYNPWTGDIEREFPDRDERGDFTETVAWSPDGKTIAQGVNAELRLYDADTGEWRNTLTFDSVVRSVAFSPDGTGIAVGGGPGGARYDGGFVKIYDAADLEEVLFDIDIGDGPYVPEVAYSPRGNTLAAVRGWGTLEIWDVATSERLHTLSGGSDDVDTSPLIFDIAFAPDDEFAYIAKETVNGDDDPVVHFFDATNFEKSGELIPGFFAARMAYSPEADNLLAVGGGTVATVALYDRETKKVVREFERCGPISALEFNSDGSLLAVAGNRDDGRIAVFARDPGSAPLPAPTLSPSPGPTPAGQTPSPTPAGQSDGAHAVSAATATALLLLAAWLA